MSVYGNTAKDCDKGIMLASELEEHLTGEPLFVVSDKTFENETIHLDFHKYERCTFRNCTLHLKYGNYRLFDCELDHCELSLEVPALGVAVLLKGYFKDKPIEFKDKDVEEVLGAV